MKHLLLTTILASVYSRTAINCHYSGRVFSTFAAANLLLFGGITELNADPLTYEVTGDTITVKDCKKTASGALVIPHTYEGKPLTKIGDDALSGCSSLTSVTIPDSVTSIAAHAFDRCSSLTSVTIGNSVTTIGGKAFVNCSSLTSVTIPDSVTSIRYSAFQGCSRLTSVTIGNSVTSIGFRTFARCSSLTSVTFEGDAPSLEDGVFNNVSGSAKVFINPDAIGFGETFEGLPVIIQEKLEINTFSKSAAPFSFSFESKSGSTYIIEATQDLRQRGKWRWRKIGGLQGTGFTVEFTDWREAIFEKQYYRLKLVE